MVTMLRLRIEHQPDETFASFVERLAIRNLQPTVRNFCADFRLTFREICLGDEYAVTKIAALSGMDHQALAHAAMKRLPDRSWQLGSERLGAPILIPHICRYCPKCILSDLEPSRQGAQLGPYGRHVWRIRQYRTCHIHHVELQQAECRGNYGSYALRRNLAPLLEEMSVIAGRALERAPTPLEAYIAERLAGKAGPAWLDSLSFTVAVRLIELVGTVKLFGPESRHWKHTDEQWRQAGETGYDIVRNGPEAFCSFLSELQTVDGRDSRDRGSADFGPIYDWLWNTKDPDAEPVRNLVCDHLENTTPVGAGQKILRRVVKERKLHSVWSAALEYGINVKSLRAYLVAAGVVPNNPASFDNHLLFPAKLNQHLLEQLSRGKTAVHARKHIGCERQVFPVLCRAGLIKPIVDSDKVVPMFDPVDLDFFLERLLRSAHAYHEKPDHLVTIALARTRVTCSQAEIVSLILDGKLKSVGTLNRLENYASILVDHREVLALTRSDQVLGGIIVSDIALDFGLPHAAVVMLLDKELPTTTQFHPRKRCLQRIVRTEDYASFKAVYVSLRDLSHAAGVHGRPLRTRLSNLGVDPYRDLGRGAYMYERAKLPN